jgi:hypothetical protein
MAALDPTQDLHIEWMNKLIDYFTYGWQFHIVEAKKDSRRKHDNITKKDFPKTKTILAKKRKYEKRWWLRKYQKKENEWLIWSDA